MEARDIHKVPKNHLKSSEAMAETNTLSTSDPC